MRVLYFASIRERIGLREETLSPPAEIATVTTLLDWLAGRSARHQGALGDHKRLKVAVNQDYAKPETVLSHGDEIAIFPPVTGG